VTTTLAMKHWQYTSLLAQNIYCRKIRNGLSGILRGPQENDSLKILKSKISCWTLTVCETLLVQEVESSEDLPAQATDVIQLKPLPPPCAQPN
jgi:hypothetical protein